MDDLGVVAAGGGHLVTVTVRTDDADPPDTAAGFSPPPAFTVEAVDAQFPVVATAAAAADAAAAAATAAAAGGARGVGASAHATTDRGGRCMLLKPYSLFP